MRVEVQRKDAAKHARRKFSHVINRWWHVFMYLFLWLVSPTYNPLCHCGLKEPNNGA